MLYLTDIIKSPCTRTLKVEDNETTTFNVEFDCNKDYKWVFSRALNEENGLDITEFDSKINKTIMFNGLLDNPESKLIKCKFDFRVKFFNGTDFSIATTNVSTKSKHMIINKKLKVDSSIDKFIFTKYKDIIYVQVNVKDLVSQSKSILLGFSKLGFSLLNG